MPEFTHKFSFHEYKNTDINKAFYPWAEYCQLPAEEGSLEAVNL